MMIKQLVLNNFYITPQRSFFMLYYQKGRGEIEAVPSSPSLRFDARASLHAHAESSISIIVDKKKARSGFLHAELILRVLSTYLHG